MFSHGLDPKTGKVINQKHELFGKEVEGKVLVRCKNPHPKGGVMLTGYAGPGWEWPKAAQSGLHCEPQTVSPE